MRTVETGAPELVNVTEILARPPFCNPEAPHGNAQEVIARFDPELAATRQILRPAARALYSQEKAWPTGQGIDLNDQSHVIHMRDHVLVHAATGLLRWGTSNTKNIPYWDREAYVVGMLNLDPDTAGENVAVLDALSINFLRAFTRYAFAKTDEYGQDVETLNETISMGQLTRSNIAVEQKEELDDVQRQQDVFKNLSAAKLKHLLWLTDQQVDPAVRHSLLPELKDLVGRAYELGIGADLLTVDMGVDTGMSEDTYRPAYVISGFRQLSHLGDTYAIPQADCHMLGVDNLLESIARPEYGLPQYEDGRYTLPWDLEPTL
jgi:hypothetical protein